MKYILGLINNLRKSLDLIKYKNLFKKHNKNNYTRLNSGHLSPNSFERIHIGDYTYGNLNILDYGDGCSLEIGRFCSIANDVVFVMGGNHRLDYPSLYPFRSMFEGGCTSYSKGDIVIEDDVWIGYGAIILSNVHIGRGAVIAAGSIVTKDVPPYSIYGGNPARLIRRRFDEDVIDSLMKIDFSKITKENHSLFLELLEAKATKESVDDLLNLLA